MAMRHKVQEKEIVERLLASDDTILACLYETYAAPLLRYFRIKFATLDELLLIDSICDALINLFQNPSQYQPHKASLKTYLITDIRGNILNAIRKIEAEDKKFHIVALPPGYGNNEAEAFEETLDEARIIELGQQVQTYFKETFRNQDDERIAWMMKIDKVRPTAPYAEILMLQHLSKEEQEAEVKRHKDRIGAQLRRKGWEVFIQKIKRDGRR